MRAFCLFVLVATIERVYISFGNPKSCHESRLHILGRRRWQGLRKEWGGDMGSFGPVQVGYTSVVECSLSPFVAAGLHTEYAMITIRRHVQNVSWFSLVHFRRGK